MDHYEETLAHELNVVSAVSAVNAVSAGIAAEEK